MHLGWLTFSEGVLRKFTPIERIKELCKRKVKFH